MSSNKFKNIFFSFLSQFIILGFGFIVPRIVLKNYGSDTNGLMSTITQIFTYLALLEAGIAQATTNALYPYIKKSNTDNDNVSKILSISHYGFRRASFVYGIIVLLLSFLLPFFLKTKLPYYTVAFYTLFEGLTSLFSFFFIQKWNSLFQVTGKNYIVLNIELIVKILCYGSKIALALLGVNIVFIQILFFLISIIKIFIYKLYIRRYYSWVKIEKTFKNDKLKDRSSYIISEIAWTVFSSTDMIILSIFCSTQMSSIYSIYNMVYLALNSLLNSVFNSLKYVLGRSFFESKEHYSIQHDNFNSIFVGIMTVLVCVAYFLIIPFIKLYTDGVADINYVYYSLPLMFSLIQLLSWSRFVSGNLTAIAGYAKYTGYISVIEAIINLLLSIIFVNKYGIHGVLIATVFALPLKVICTNYISDVIILKRKLWCSIKILGCNWLIFLTTVILNTFIKLPIRNLFNFCGYGLVLLCIYVIVIIVINCLFNKHLFLLLKSQLKKFNKS